MSNNLDVYNQLFHDDIVEWHSDSGDYDEVNIVKIKKIEKEFIVSFKIQKKSMNSFRYSICFCNSGSRYNPFNIIFMRMYDELQKYDPEYQQIHIEEYMYQKTLKR